MLRRLLGFERWKALLPLLFLSGLLGAAASPVQAADKVVLGFGDSLMAGYGVGPADSVPARLEQALRRQGHAVKVHNAGVSGDTSAGGLARLDWVLHSLPAKPDLVILELGANDALRGLDPNVTRANLDAMLKLLTARKIPVLLAGMYAPRNLGRDYIGRFDSIYPELARRYDVPLYPFFLDGVALNPSLNQPDRIHPNPKGVAIIVERIAPHVVRALGLTPGSGRH